MSAFKIIKRTLSRARPYRMYVSGIFLLNILASPLYLLKPLALKVLIDSGFGSGPLPGFITIFFQDDHEFAFMTVVWISIALLLLVALLENLYTVVIWMLNAFTGEKLVRSFRLMLFDHMQRLSIAYHDRKGTADAVYRVQNDTSAIKTLIIGNLSPILTSIISLVSILFIMFAIHWHFGLITCCMIPPMALLIKYSTRKLKRDWKVVKSDESRAMSIVQEVLTSLRLVKSFGRENEESRRFMSRADLAMKGQLNVAKTGAIFYFCVGMIYATGTAGMIYYGSIYVQTEEITLGVLTMVLAYLAQVYTPLEKISRNLNEIQSSLTSLDRVYNLLDEEKEVKEAAHPVPLSESRGSIEFRNVSFCYNQERKILDDVSFIIHPGDRVGIVGSTGAGKSTLFNLLMRFYDPSSGMILMDGTDIRKYNLQEYRKQFAMVLQDPVLFSTSIAENISYGVADAEMKEIIAAAKLANVHEFISTLPDGYDCIAGERGMTLSGGERQRIAIARAFIKNSPVLILDEPTSSLDVKTESQIMEAIQRLMKGRTTFLITHRLDILDSCSVILHLEKGRIVEIISNNISDELSKKKRNLYSRQATF